MLNVIRKAIFISFINQQNDNAEGFVFLLNTNKLLKGFVTV
jgi:hypothetical protein